MAWAKLHTDILGDPKLMRAARKGARELIYLPWLIAFAKQANDRGRLSVGGEPADPVDISDLIPGATAKAVATALTALERIDVLGRDSDGALFFWAWEKRAETKPSDTPSAIGERVRRHREKQRNAANADGGNADSNADSIANSETPCNALQETPANATEEKRGEGEEKQKREVHPPRAASGEESPPAAKHARASRSGQRTWLTPYAEIWKAKFGGEMPVGPATDHLAPLRKDWGDAEVLRRWKNYIAVATAQYVNPARFASTWSHWNHAHDPAAKQNGRPSTAEQMTASMQRLFNGAQAVRAGGDS